MTPGWSELMALLGRHPFLAAPLTLAIAVGAPAFHVWRLRWRERQLTALVDERTRLWRDEVRAHAALRSLAAPCSTPASSLGSPEVTPAVRVLVVGERRETHEAMQAAFGDLGVVPVFADSRWAAAVAARQADAEGVPYDVILVDAALEGSEALPAGTGTGA
jgi:hypothetical protein